MVGWDVQNSKGFLVELKTGFNEVFDYDAHDGESYMRMPYGPICAKDTALNRAAVQLLFPLIVLEKRYGIHMDGALVFRTASVGDESSTAQKTAKTQTQPRRSTQMTQMYSMPTWCLDWDCQDAIYDAILTNGLEKLVGSRVSQAKRQVLHDLVLSDPNKAISWHPLVSEYYTWFNTFSETKKKGKILFSARELSGRESTAEKDCVPWQPFQNEEMLSERQAQYQSPAQPHGTRIVIPTLSEIQERRRQRADQMGVR
jgi:hypothetical protein